MTIWQEAIAVHASKKNVPCQSDRQKEIISALKGHFELQAIFSLRLDKRESRAVSLWTHPACSTLVSELSGPNLTPHAS